MSVTRTFEAYAPPSSLSDKMRPHQYIGSPVQRTEDDALLQGLGQARRIELRIGQAQRRAGIDQHLRIARLMIIHRMRIRHEHGGQACCRQF